MIKGQLEPLYRIEFPSSFRSLNVVEFSNGSIFNKMDLSFISTSVPNNTQIVSVLINAASNVTGFDIEGSSITVDGILPTMYIDIDSPCQFPKPLPCPAPPPFLCTQHNTLAPLPDTSTQPAANSQLCPCLASLHSVKQVGLAQ
ncbi:gamete and mating-type specific protein A-like isoform X1 [Lates japonicus]|uniref:Gamete and mating-type specific protein A-like isoform X1 n=1 Tax=Lates japonicus TaxID=270547 RepID=A0AAD3NHN5_LATJO|nr:gamete and mating-type specific protein A-like isoform X1 [Lates japonicus]